MCLTCMYVHIKSSFLHLEFLEMGAAFLSWCSHDIQEIWSEHEGNPLLTDSHEALVIPQDVAEVDVEQIPCRNKRRVLFCHCCLFSRVVCLISVPYIEHVGPRSSCSYTLTKDWGYTYQPWHPTKNRNKNPSAIFVYRHFTKQNQNSIFHECPLWAAVFYGYWQWSY